METDSSLQFLKKYAFFFSIFHKYIHTTEHTLSNPEEYPSKSDLCRCEAKLQGSTFSEFRTL